MDSLSRLRFLADAGRTLAESLDYETTLRNVAKLVVPVHADYCAIDLLDASGTLRRIAVEHVDPARVDLVRQLQERYPTDPDAPVGVHAVLRTREPQRGDVTPEMLRRSAKDDEHRRILDSLDLRSYMIVPLIARGEVLGALTFVLSESDESYDDVDVAFACELAARAALAIDSARLVAELKSTQANLEHTAAELESQTEELQATVEELEAATQELFEANEQLTAAHDESKQAREEAEQARHAADDARVTAEEANQAKSQFLATMSHELRTPLNAIDGYAELLELGIHGPLSAAQRQSIERLRRAQKRLLSLVNDVLNFAKLEAGQVLFDMQDTAIAEILDTIDPLIRPQAEARAQTLTIEPPPDIWIHADTQKTEQILLNLIANAIKFTPAGGRIVVSVSATTTHASIRVTDTGEGIPKNRLRAIFDPFVQVSAGMVRDQGGVGLGLAISRDLARSMDGDIVVHSSPGVGSTFTLLLPLSSRPTHVQTDLISD